MDTRTPSPSPIQRRPTSDSNGPDAQAEEEEYKPDLSQEVAMLSTKLVNAINYQTNLDDSLQASRHETDKLQQELARVRAEKQSLDDAIAQGVLVKKVEVDRTIARLREELAKERARREEAEKAKRQTDSELENLTANLFEEANKMVASARKDTEAVEKRNSQLKSQIKDTEVLLASQQEQLQDLKLTMEKLEHVDINGTRDSSVPSTPVNAATAFFDALHMSPTGPVAPANLPPTQPLRIPQLIQPVLRSDVAAYTDFAELLGWARHARQNNFNLHSRNSSGNMANASVSQTNLPSMSSPNLPGAFSFGSSSANNSPSSASFAPLAPPLKESKFYKRTLVEDIEPTLRLDLAPGLSFLSRRTVNTSILNGTLGIEPFAQPAASKFYSPVFACALCGESRKTEPYIRRHRFRTDESESGTKYPLCAYCLERVRASAELVGFLKVLRDGHLKCGSEDEEKSAWEESVRLRERCFWARVGGGVVPAVNVPRVPEPLSPVKNRQSSEGERVVSQAMQDANDEVARDAELRAHPPVTKTRQSEGDEDGISRAIVNMASTAATTAVSELPPRTEPMPAVAIVTPENPPATSESQQDQADADAQLQQEADAAPEPEMRTPPETPQQEPEVTPISDSAVGRSELPEEDTGLKRASLTTPPASRPTSSSSIRSGRRTPSPAKNALSTRPDEKERRPSSNSVLDRVRAMEAARK